MDNERGHSRKALVCLNEFMGQVFFMYIVLVSAGTGSDAWGITGPLALFAVVNIFGGISGGHFNPAVTLGIYVREGKYAENFIFALMYIFSQACGALVGMSLAYLVLRIEVDGKYTVPPSSVPLLLPSSITKEVIDSGNVELVENFTTFYMEVVCTFVFVALILHVTGSRTGGMDLGAWKVPAICLNLWALCSVDYFTAASFNPALALGSTVFQYWQYPNNPDNVLTHYMFIYMAGAALGGIIAGLWFHIHNGLFPEPEHEDEHHLHESVNEKVHQDDHHSYQKNTMH